MSEQLSILADRMIHRLMTDQFLDGFSDRQLIAIIDAVRKILEPVGCLIQISAPVIIFGDIHGQFGDLMRFLKIVGTPPEQNFLFLGDYIDRCKKGLEVIMLLFCFKVKYPDKINLLRGNHECTKMNRTYGFYQECKRVRTTVLWKTFQKAFNELPLCANISNRLVCMHGGISPLIHGWHSLKNLKKPRNQVDCDSGLALDLMWSDPDNDPCAKGFTPNKIRNASWMFGQDVIRECVAALDVDMIVRAHEVVKNGHQIDCDGKLCTVFTAPNYCGSDGNCGSIMRVTEDLKISFVTLKPKLDMRKLSAEKLAELEKQNRSNATAKSPNPGMNLLPTEIITSGRQ
uniref:Serine/threonine-protein phosphatase n=1 Tax=Elaeophora elaphi TaxID=1147741 RepID=A0A0R3S255_9BILA